MGAHLGEMKHRHTLVLVSTCPFLVFSCSWMTGLGKQGGDRQNTALLCEFFIKSLESYWLKRSPRAVLVRLAKCKTCCTQSHYL